MKARQGTYIASRTFDQYIKRWKELRDVQGFTIVSSWIDGCKEVDQGLWSQIAEELAGAERLVLYVENGDFPLKGALVEVGMALGAGIKVFVVAPGVEIDPESYRPIGSWLTHPLVTQVATIEEALIGASKTLKKHNEEESDESKIGKSGFLSDQDWINAGCPTE